MSAVVPVLCVFGVVFILGVGAGLHLAWTQGSKCKKFVNWYVDTYEKNKGIT